METEMQNDALNEVDAGAAETEVNTQNLDSSTGTQDENKVELSDKAQERFNQVTAEKYSLKREKEKLEAELRKYKESEGKPVTSDLSAPALPDDIYDEDAMRKYHQESAEYNRKIAEQAAASTYAKQQETVTQAQQAEEQQKVVQAYAKQGLKDGLTIEQMQLNEQVLNGAGISPELGGFIMADSNGAKIADHLANNPEDLSKVRGMNPMQAAVFIANEVKVKAMGPKNVSSAPPPANTLTTGSASVTTDDFDSQCPGAVFE